jgi:hypothetical protein
MPQKFENTVMFLRELGFAIEEYGGNLVKVSHFILKRGKRVFRTV